MIKFIDLKEQKSKIKNKINLNIKKVLNHQKFIMGPEVNIFENKIKKIFKCKYITTCANGTDAISLSLMAWNIQPGDIVFCPSYSYVSPAECIAQLGAIPYFVDVSLDDFNIDIKNLKLSIDDCRKKKLKIKAIICVDLFGQPCRYDILKKIAKNNNLKLLIDGAQSFGSLFKNKYSCNYGDIYITSFFSLKTSWMLWRWRGCYM